MALLYPWATKEYLLWEMTLGQIIFYHSIGLELKYPGIKKDSEVEGLVNKSPEELRKMREDFKKQYGDI